MAGVAWPFNETYVGGVPSGAPAVSARQKRQMNASFVAMGSSARPLGAKSGVRVGTPASVVTITGSGSSYTWSAGGFGGTIDGEANAAAGAYQYAFENAETGSISAQGAAARKDRLDVQISDSDEGDGAGTKTVQVIYTQGAATGGAVPDAPARSHALGIINVPATTGAPTFTWAPEWAGTDRWTFNTIAERDAYTTLITSVNVPPRQHATVIADTVSVNNGTYLWSGTGWVLASTNPAIIVRRSTTGVSGGANVWQQLTTAGWWSQDYNTGFATFDGTIVAPVTGWYRLFTGLTFSTSAPSTLLMVTKNNASNTETGNILRYAVPQVAGETGGYTSKLVKLTAGDVLRLQIFPTGSWTWGTDPDDGVFGLELAYI